MNKLKRGFTLIELLVVIAIIAILAAILFPVFAQAKAAAKATAALSNTKQLELGILMYQNDYDDTYPLGMSWQSKTDNWELGYLPNGPFFSSWGWLIAPYLKNGQIFADPTATQNPASQSVVAFQAFYTQFGYNYEFLSPYLGTSSAEYPVPANGTTGADLANTVALTSKWAEADNTTPYIYYTGVGGMFSDAASQAPVCDSLLAWCNGDWGQGSQIFDVPPVGYLGLPITEGRYTAGNSYRVANHVTTAYCDGHSKSVPYQSLALGTNFNIASPHGVAGSSDNIVVTSAAKYPWSLSKTCADFTNAYTTDGLQNCSP